MADEALVRPSFGRLPIRHEHQAPKSGPLLADDHFMAPLRPHRSHLKAWQSAAHDEHLLPETSGKHLIHGLGFVAENRLHRTQIRQIIEHMGKTGQDGQDEVPRKVCATRETSRIYHGDAWSKLLECTEACDKHRPEPEFDGRPFGWRQLQPCAALPCLQSKSKGSVASWNVPPR